MTEWDDQALQARIKRDGKERYAAGSPDSTEIAVYRSLLQRALADDARDRHILILGMTPELRRLAAALGCRTTCVDINPRSIALYRDWLSAEQRRNETVVQGDWLKLPQWVSDPADVILGDGLFGNLHTIDDHRALLANMKECLVPGGAVIQRNIFVPRLFSLQDHAAPALLRAFRAREINEDEFGFAMRIWGSFSAAYDAKTLLLDNKRVYDIYARWHEEGRLSAVEHALTRRYYFAGRNLIPGEELWECLLTECGFDFERQHLSGRPMVRLLPDLLLPPASLAVPASCKPGTNPAFL
jgi:SAM-dependent methyltransferase